MKLTTNDRTMTDSKILINPTTKTSSASASTSTSESQPMAAEAPEEEEEEEYLTGLEGFGRTASLATLQQAEFSPSNYELPYQVKNCTSTTCTSSSSSVADLSKRSTKTYEWVEHLLESILNPGSHTSTHQMKHCLLQKDITSLFKCLNDAEEYPYVISAIPSEDRRVLIVDYDIIDFDQPVTLNEGPIPLLSRLLSLKVKYMVKGCDDIKYDLYVLKIPSEYEEEHELARLATAHRREISFYSRILPFLQEWSLSQNVAAAFAIPLCHYALYNRTDKQPLQNILDNLPAAESIIVLQDLRVEDFGKRNYMEGLSIDEVKAALFELAKVHVASWAFDQKNSIHVGHLFANLQKPEQIAFLYETLLQNGFKKLKIYLQKQTTLPGRNHKLQVDILQKIRSLELRARSILLELMQPPDHPEPSCLIHLDFWCDNILFRKLEGADDSRPQNTSTTDAEYWNSVASPPDLDEAYNSASTSSKSGNALATSGATADGDNDEPKYLEYLTDPRYANLEFINDTYTNAVQENMNNANAVPKRVRISDSTLECRIIDWQMVSYGSPIHDLAMLLVTSLAPEVRRRTTDMFIKYYHQVFEETASIFSLDIHFNANSLRRQYRKSKLLATLLLIASVEMVLADETTEDRFMELLKELLEDKDKSDR